MDNMDKNPKGNRPDNGEPKKPGLREKPTVDFCIFDMPPCHHGLLQPVYQYAAGQFQRDYLR